MIYTHSINSIDNFQTSTGKKSSIYKRLRKLKADREQLLSDSEAIRKICEREISNEEGN